MKPDTIFKTFSRNISIKSDTLASIGPQAYRIGYKLMNKCKSTLHYRVAVALIRDDVQQSLEVSQGYPTIFFDFALVVLRKCICF